MAASINVLKERFEEEHSDYLKWGIHVMVAQNESGELSQAHHFEMLVKKQYQLHYRLRP